MNAQTLLKNMRQIYTGRCNALSSEKNQTPFALSASQHRRMKMAKWDLSKLEGGYYDRNDYSDIIALHFYMQFAPWDKHNLRFYPIWKEYQG